MALRHDIAQLLPRLRELSIRECEMFPELPESFTSLSNLETLIISSYSFCQLTSLETFILTECGEMDQLPDEFCNLTSLQTLCIMHSEEYEYPIPDGIAGFPRLHTLYLRSVSVHELLPSLPQLTSLTRLELDRCLMEGGLPGDLGELSNLQQLHISFCPVRSLPASFTALTSLQILTIEHCTPLASIAAGSLHNLTRLKQLELAGCHLRTEPPHLLPRSLEVLSLELPHRVPSLPDLSMLTNLRRMTLNLEGTGQGATGICSSSSSSSSSSRSWHDLKNLEQVEYLEVTIGQAVEAFPFPRFPFPQLRVLKISFGTRIQKLPLHLGCDLAQLRKLHLYCMEGVTELPHTITQLQHLTSLDVGYASHLASLPDGIGALSRLRRLCLSHCSALQNLPTSLTRLTCLHQLNAEGTSIRTLPSVAQLTRLKWLYLGKCNQLQALPEGLTDLKLLRFLGVKGSDVAIGSAEAPQHEFVYRISPEAEWRAAQDAGCFVGSDFDRQSGFIHLSTADQVGGTLLMFFPGRDDLMLLQIRAHALGSGLVYERVPDLGHFPHFYSPAPPANSSASDGRSEAASLRRRACAAALPLRLLTPCRPALPQSPPVLMAAVLEARTMRGTGGTGGFERRFLLCHSAWCEQRVPVHEEVDAHDGLGALPAVPPSAMHFLATVHGVPAGAGRCVVKGDGTAKVGRIATLPQFRRQGVGRAIMHCIHEQAAKQGCVRSTLGAQLEAVPFYERLGYTVTSGEVFLDAGIEHVDMHRALVP
ncbi:unnamed protein product [Closterium sp. Yama58-4]|nr:unnamed protein product [Closterium sp. Yama58-4]